MTQFSGPQSLQCSLDDPKLLKAIESSLNESVNLSVRCGSQLSEEQLSVQVKHRFEINEHRLLVLES